MNPIISYFIYLVHFVYICAKIIYIISFINYRAYYEFHISTHSYQKIFNYTIGHAANILYELKLFLQEYFSLDLVG